MAELDEIRVAWRPEEFTEARREFRGRIIRAEWGTPEGKYKNDWVFPPNAPEDIRQRQVERGAVAVRIEIMPIDKSWENIYEWYTVTDIRLSKWFYFIDSLNRTKTPYSFEGNTVAERLSNFCKSLVGMEFKWEDHENLPTVGRNPIKRLLLPTEYYGKFEVGEIEKVEI